MRKPKISEDFGLENSIGLSNCLVGNCSVEEAIHQTSFENLDIH